MCSLELAYYHRLDYIEALNHSRVALQEGTGLRRLDIIGAMEGNNVNQEEEEVKRIDVNVDVDVDVDVEGEEEVGKNVVEVVEVSAVYRPEVGNLFKGVPNGMSEEVVDVLARGQRRPTQPHHFKRPSIQADQDGHTPEGVVHQHYLGDKENKVFVERIVSHGHTTDWYDQDFTEFCAVLAGEAQLTFGVDVDADVDVDAKREENNAVVQLGVGDYVVIPPHVRHRVSWTNPERPTIWIAVKWTE